MQHGFLRTGTAPSTIAGHGRYVAPAATGLLTTWAAPLRRRRSSSRPVGHFWRAAPGHFWRASKLTGAEVRYFLRTLRRYRDVAIVHVMLLCGLRSAEILQLRLGDVLVDDGQLRVRGKGDRERVLPLSPIVARVLGDYVRWERPASNASARLFVILQGPRRGRPMTPSGLRSLFRHRRRDHVVARANPHRFRHTFGADMARSGVRLPVLQRMMGHADDSTTLRYIQLSMGDIADEYRRAVEKIQQRYRDRG